MRFFNLFDLECKPQDVSIYLKEGSPPVINPDGSTFPKRLLNVSRPDVYNLEIKSDKTPHYVNLTSPIPGTYYAATFISWTDPTNAAITQQGFCLEDFYHKKKTTGDIVLLAKLRHMSN